MAFTSRRTSAEVDRVGGRAGLCITAGVLVGVLLVVLAVHDGQVHALKAAGAFHGEAISGVEGLVNKLKGNVVWFGVTVMGLMIAVIGVMFLAGHSRAHDLALKTLVGVTILASVSGIVA
jgi:hypothetical protein